MREDGRWRTWGDPVRTDMLDVRTGVDEFVDDLLERRCYPVFAIFGVRMSGGDLPPLACRGYPPEMDGRSYIYLCDGGHSTTWATLRELLFDVDWSKVDCPHSDFLRGLGKLALLLVEPSPDRPPLRRADEVRLIMNFDN
jgi:hypothetical protein